MSDVRILNSWKEISSYIGRGVRTVQRWEELYGLPVHRAAGKDRSAVYAMSDELDAWLRLGKMHGQPAPKREASLECAQRVEELLSRSRLLVRQLRELRRTSTEVRSRLRSKAARHPELQDELTAASFRLGAAVEDATGPSLQAGAARGR